MSHSFHQNTNGGALPTRVEERNGNVHNPVTIMFPSEPQLTAMDTDERDESYGSLFPKKMMLTLSSIQCLMAVFGIVSQVVGMISTDSQSNSDIRHLGTGIWCGVIFGLSGALGIAASLRPNSPMIFGNMIFSIISAGFCLPLLIISAIGTANSRVEYFFQ